MAQNGYVTPGRYWGPTAVSVLGKNVEPRTPEAENQASLLLARINARARARKAGKPVIIEASSSLLTDAESLVPVKTEEKETKQTKEEAEALQNFETTDAVAGDDIHKEKKKKKKKKRQECESDFDVAVTELRPEEQGSKYTDKNNSLNRELDDHNDNDAEHKHSGICPESQDCSDADVERKKRRADIEEEEVNKSLVKKKKKHKKDKHIDIQKEIETGTSAGLNNSVRISHDEITEASTTSLTSVTPEKESVSNAMHEPVSDKVTGEVTEEDGNVVMDEDRAVSKKKKKRKNLEDVHNLEYAELIPSEKRDRKTVEVELQKKGGPASDAEDVDGFSDQPKNALCIEECAHEAVAELQEKATLDNEQTKKRAVLKPRKKKKKKKKAKPQKSGEIGGFTIMGKVATAKKKKVHRTLPEWLANPTVISRDLLGGSSPLDFIPDLSRSLKDTLVKQGICNFFPVQKAVIPELLASASPLSLRYRPRDVCVSAPTGSGKTLAFVLPIVQGISSRTVPRIRALVLLPVQELAVQVYNVFKTYANPAKLKVGLAVGQKSFEKEQTSLVQHDCAGFHSCVDILVATPGKLADHLRLTKGFTLEYLRYLVLDEADRMLAADGGNIVSFLEKSLKCHQEDVENVLISGFQGSGPLQYPQPPLQRLLFSATLSRDPEILQKITLYRPKLFYAVKTTYKEETAGDEMSDRDTVCHLNQFVRPAELKEEFIAVEEALKPLLLYHLALTQSWRKVIIFTETLKANHRLSVLLTTMSDKLRVAEFSSQNKENRQKIVSRFSSGKIDILVSTDVMARGLDIPDVERVICYDVVSANTYIHRVGRTARAGKPGTALSLVTPNKETFFKKLLGEGAAALTKVPIDTELLEQYEDLYTNALSKMKEVLQEEEYQRKQKIVSENERWRKKVPGGTLKGKGTRKFVTGIKKD